MKKLFYSLVLLSQYSILQICTAQTVLLEQDVNADTIPPATGPNMKNYNHTYFRYGFVLGKSDSAGVEIMPGLSSDFTFGYRYKRRIANFFALGFDINYSNVVYRLKQDSSKIFPNNILHKKEKFAYNNLGAEIFTRFNFGKRGNILGNFLDLGGFGEWAFKVKHYFKDEPAVTNVLGANTVETTNSHLVYVNPVNYGALAKFGINRYVIYAKYRLSNLFKKDYVVAYPDLTNNTELARIIVGVEIGLLK